MGAAFDPFFEALLAAGRLTDRPDIEMQTGKMKGATKLVTPVRFVGKQINELIDLIPEGSRPTARAVLNMVKGKTKNQDVKDIIDEVNRAMPPGQALSDVALDTLLARVPADFRRAVKAHIRASLPSFFVDQPDIDKPQPDKPTGRPPRSTGGGLGGIFGAGRADPGDQTSQEGFAFTGESGRGEEFDEFVRKAREHVRQKTGVPTDEQREAARAAREKTRGTKGDIFGVGRDDDLGDQTSQEGFAFTGELSDEEREALEAAMEAARVKREADKAARDREQRSAEEAARVKREADKAAREAEQAEKEAEAAREEQARLDASRAKTLKLPPPMITKDPSVLDPDPQAVHHRGQNQTSHTYGVDFTAGGRPSQFTDLGPDDPRFFRRQAAATVSPQTALARPAPKKKRFIDYLEEADGRKTQNFVSLVGDSNASYGAWINRYNIKYSTAPPFDPTSPIRVRT